MVFQRSAIYLNLRPDATIENVVPEQAVVRSKESRADLYTFHGLKIVEIQIIAGSIRRSVTKINLFLTRISLA